MSETGGAASALEPRSPAPRVSVIVPTRDRRTLLEELLNALRKQTWTDFEVIVVDDGSRDGTSSAVTAAATDGLPVGLVRTSGVGAVAARRAGVDEARGEILAFTDSDCVPDPEWLAEGVAAVDAGADLVQGRTEPARELGPLERSVAHGGPDGLFATCNIFYRRPAYETAGGFDMGAADRLRFRPGSRARGLGFGEDTLLGWRVRRRGRVEFAPSALVHHAVLRPGIGELLSRAWMAGAFPALVREVPELRERLLRRRIVLGRSRLPAYGTLAALLTRRRPLIGLTLVWWVSSRARELRRSRGSHGDRLAAVPVEMAIDVVTGAALLWGSLRARTPVF